MGGGHGPIFANPWGWRLLRTSRVTSGAMAKYEFRVEVAPQYLPEQSTPGEAVYCFAYTVTITNTGEVPAQLISRHWQIIDAAGKAEEVKGLGVVGHQPLLKPGESFRYTSGCRLRTPSGTMQGTYYCVADDGQAFEAQIPLFFLDDGSRRVLH